jgi:hypothetical protein
MQDHEFRKISTSSLAPQIEHIDEEKWKDQRLQREYYKADYRTRQNLEAEKESRHRAARIPDCVITIGPPDR